MNATLPSSWNYWYKSYGKLGNRPLDEIRLVSNIPLIIAATGVDYSNTRHLDHDANRALGYINGERAMLLAAIDAQTTDEILFAWRMEMILAKLNRDLQIVRSSMEPRIQTS